MTSKLLKFFTLGLMIVMAACSKQKTPELTGKTLHIPVKDSFKSLDPATSFDNVSGPPLYDIYEPLLQYSYFKEKPQVEPKLADGMPVVSKDGLTITIKIKKGILFQNDPAFADGKGREVKAKDFLYAWKRHAVPRTASEGAWIFSGKVVGYDDLMKAAKEFKTEEDTMNAEVAGFKALDDYTIQIKLLRPYPQLQWILAMGFVAPISIEAVKKYGEEFRFHPVGTGPFKALSVEPQSKIVLTKNENFRDEKFPAANLIDEEFKESRIYSGKKLPLVDNIVYRAIKEDQPRWLEMVSGAADQIEIPKDNTLNVITLENPTELKADMKEKGFKLSIDKGPIHRYFAVNMEDSLLGQNKYLRQALSSAIDRNEYLRIYRQARGDLADEYSPEGVNERCGKRKLKYGYDLKRAKALLAKAGYPDGKGLPEIKFDMNGADATSRQIAEFVSKQMSLIGVKLKISLNTFPAYLEKRVKKNLQFFHSAWNLDYPDAENIFQLLHGPAADQNASDSNFRNAKFDELYAKISTMPYGPARQNVICEMEDIVQEETPIFYGFYENMYRLISPRLKNFHAQEMGYGNYKYADLSN